MKVGCLLILMTALAQSGSDPLPRRGYFGVGLEKAENGARVSSVAPDSTAAAAKIVGGDIIEELVMPGMRRVRVAMRLPPEAESA